MELVQLQIRKIYVYIVFNKRDNYTTDYLFCVNCSYIYLKFQGLSPVVDKAAKIIKASATIETTKTNINGSIESLNSGPIQQSVDTCSSLRQDYIAFQSKSSVVSEEVQNASNSASTTRVLSSQILQAINAIGIINTEQMPTLLTRIQSLAEDFTNRNLETAVTQLKALADEQRTWLESAKSKKAELQTKIQNLKAMQQQLSST